VPFHSSIRFVPALNMNTERVADRDWSSGKTDKPSSWLISRTAGQSNAATPLNDSEVSYRCRAASPDRAQVLESRTLLVMSSLSLLTASPGARIFETVPHPSNNPPESPHSNG
jgi:hypothetical protein